MPNVYEIVTQRLIALLEEGTAPWRKTWRGSSEAPKNLISGREYRGINVWLLAAQGYASPDWLTFRQATQRDARVRKGEKGALVVFWKMVASREDPDEQRPVLRYYTVFNRDQCQGLTPRVPGEPVSAPSIVSAEELLATLPAGSAPIRTGPQPCYRPAGDEICMPARHSFASAEEHYATLYHELAHNAASSVMPTAAKATAIQGTL